MIHGDLKPANLLIGGDRRVKLADFGSVLTWSEAGGRWEGPLNGTPAFRAPETLAHPADLSPQVGLVSAGIGALLCRSPASERVQGPRMLVLCALEAFARRVLLHAFLDLPGRRMRVEAGLLGWLGVESATS